MGASVPPCYLIIAVRCDSLVDPRGPGRNSIVRGIVRSRMRRGDTTRVARPRKSKPPDHRGELPPHGTPPPNTAGDLTSVTGDISYMFLRRLSRTKWTASEPMRAHRACSAPLGRRVSR